MVALIACASRKLNRAAPARDLYRSPLFRLSMRYAEAQGADQIFILSAKHGLLDAATVIEPYNLSLNKMSLSDVRRWAERVIADLSKVVDLDKSRFLILAGQRYSAHLLPRLPNCEIPLAGLSIG
jgi:hypothetical protein